MYDPFIVPISGHDHSDQATVAWSAALVIITVSQRSLTDII